MSLFRVPRSSTARTKQTARRSPPPVDPAVTRTGTMSKPTKNFDYQEHAWTVNNKNEICVRLEGKDPSWATLQTQSSEGRCWTGTGSRKGSGYMIFDGVALDVSKFTATSDTPDELKEVMDTREELNLKEIKSKSRTEKSRTTLYALGRFNKARKEGIYKYSSFSVHFSSKTQKCF